MFFSFRQKISWGRLGILALMAVFALVFFFTTGTVEVLASETAKQQNEKQIQIFLNSKPVVFDVSPIIVNGRVLAPFRTIGEALGAEVYWDGQNQEVTLKTGGMTFETGGNIDKGLKEGVATARKKLSTDLLQLIDEKYLPPGQSGVDLKRRMQALKQFYPASAAEQTGNGKAAGARVYVYIYLEPPVNTHDINEYAWEVTDRDEENHLAVAWVEVENLEALASRESVRMICTVTPPATTSKCATKIKLKIGAGEAFVNGEQINLDVPACIINGRTMAPLRFISESLDTVVDWDESNYTVYISSS